MEQEKIYINIWDDFSDSEDDEDGKKTHAYVECDLNIDDCKEVLQLLEKTIDKCLPNKTFNMELVYCNPKEEFAYITDTDNDDEGLFSPYWKIQFTNIDYYHINQILDSLSMLTLTYKNIPLEIYSES